jgi:transcriptional regulator with XRE-family HTH domain
MIRLDERLGKKIARYRNNLGLTQAELAEAVNVQPETISRIETGHRAASLELLPRLARALELNLSELFRHRDGGNPKERALERLLQFASLLSPAQIDVVIEVSALLVRLTGRRQPG